MAFKPRVVIAEVGTLAQKPIQLETENEKLIITTFSSVACDILFSTFMGSAWLSYGWFYLP